jgi:hypothetical protein
LAPAGFHCFKLFLCKETGRMLTSNIFCQVEILIVVGARVARFFPGTTYQNWENIPKDHKYHKSSKILPNFNTICTKWLYNIPKMSTLRPPKTNQIGIFHRKNTIWQPWRGQKNRNAKKRLQTSRVKIFQLKREWDFGPFSRQAEFAA